MLLSEKKNKPKGIAVASMRLGDRTDPDPTSRLCRCLGVFLCNRIVMM